MDQTLIMTGILALLLLIVVLILVQLNRKAVRFRENESFPDLATPGGGSGFFSNDDGEPAPNPVVDSPPISAEHTGGPSDAGSLSADAAEAPEFTLADTASSEAAGDAGTTGTASSEAPSRPSPPGGLPLRPQPASATGNPAAALIESIVAGQGDLTQEELRRLELYRPQKLMEAIAEQEEALSGKGKERRRARLMKVRQYALALAPEGEELAVGSGSSGDLPEAAPPAGRTEFEEAEPPSQEEKAAEPGGPEPEVPQPEIPEPEPLDHYEQPEELEPIANEEQIEETSLPVEEPDLTEDYSEWVVEDEHDFPTESETWESWEAPEAEAEPELELEAEAEIETEEDEIEMEYETETETEEGPALDLAGMDLQIERAEDVLELPSAERIDALSFLDPEELARTFTLASDAELKKAVVDTLEERGDATALNALNTCLEDSDPAMQLYALDATERLLARIEEELGG